MVKKLTYLGTNFVHLLQQLYISVTPAVYELETLFVNKTSKFQIELKTLIN